MLQRLSITRERERREEEEEVVEDEMAWSSVPVLIGFSAIQWCFFKKSGNFSRLFLLSSIVAHINNSACNAFNL